VTADGRATDSPSERFSFLSEGLTQAKVAHKPLCFRKSPRAPLLEFLVKVQNNSVSELLNRGFPTGTGSMGITLGIQNDLNYAIQGKIKFKGGANLSETVEIQPGETFKRTDRVRAQRSQSLSLGALSPLSPAHSGLIRV
jgi:hypothetical protein